MVRTENPKDIIERFGVGQMVQKLSSKDLGLDTKDPKLTSKEFGVDKEPKVNLERV